MRIEAGSGLSCLQSRSKSRSAILCKKCGIAIAASRPASAKKSTDGPIQIVDITAPENIEGERKSVTADGRGLALLVSAPEIFAEVGHSRIMGSVRSGSKARGAAADFVRHGAFTRCGELPRLVGICLAVENRATLRHGDRLSVCAANRRCQRLRATRRASSRSGARGARCTAICQHVWHRQTRK
jgi:hypothetical protein